MVQVSTDEILIFGGLASDKELRAIYYWNINDGVIRKANKVSDVSINPGTMPSVLAIDSTVITGESGTPFIYLRQKTGVF